MLVIISLNEGTKHVVKRQNNNKTTKKRTHRVVADVEGIAPVVDVDVGRFLVLQLEVQCNLLAH